MSVLRVGNPLWSFLSNPYPRPTNDWLKSHIPGKEVKHTLKVTREGKEHFFPKENKTSNHLLELSDFIKEVTEELKKIFHEKWVQELFGKNAEEKSGQSFEALVKSGMNSEQAKEIVDYGIQNAKRIKNWSHDNEKVGKVASTFMNFAIPLGIIRNIISGLEVVPTLIHRIISFAYALTSSLRGYYQYSDRVYNRPDDEAAMNRYQSEVYGNKVAGGFGTTACFMETKINPFVLPFAGLFEDKKVLDNTLALFTIPNLSWWRGRMPAHINQEYLTDLIRFLVHKPSSLLGIRSSKKVIQEIKERGNLEAGYVVKRHYENLGLQDKKDQRTSRFISEAFKLLKNSLSNDVKIQQESTMRLGETIAPLFGFTAFVSTVLGVPLKALFKFIDKQSRIVDVFASLSLSCQQCIYLFKMVIPVFNDLKRITLKLNVSKLITKMKEDGEENNTEELKTLFQQKKNLSKLGLLTFSTSIINTTLKLFKFDNEYFEKTKSAVEGLAGDLVSKFFSERRYVLGFQFKAENPEFYEEEEEQGQKVTDILQSGKNQEQEEKTIEPQVVIKALPVMN